MIPSKNTQNLRLVRKFFTALLLSLTFQMALCLTQIIFNATDEWQLVPEGVDIPAGLHVKMDLTSGGRWAKLLDKSNESSSENEQNTNIIVTNKDQAIRHSLDFNQEKLENEMADLLSLNPLQKTAQRNIDLEAQTESERKLRLEKLKAFMNDIDKNVESDFEKMTRYVNKLEDLSSSHETDNSIYVDICENLDWIISKVDNAHDAAKQGILSKLIEIYRKDPSKYIWRIFSASAQNNPPVAKALFKPLLPLIEETIKNLEYDSDLLKSCIYSLSAISRSISDENVMEIDWSGLIGSKNGQNEYFCNLLRELENVPYNCQSGGQKEEL